MAVGIEEIDRFCCCCCFCFCFFSHTVYVLQMINRILWVACTLKVSIQFCQRNHTRKFSNIYKDFELNQVFMHNFPCQEVLIFPLYILLTIQIDTFLFLAIDKILVWWYQFCLDSKIIQEMRPIFTEIFRIMPTFN